MQRTYIHSYMYHPLLYRFFLLLCFYFILYPCFNANNALQPHYIHPAGSPHTLHRRTPPCRCAVSLNVIKYLFIYLLTLHARSFMNLLSTHSLIHSLACSLILLTHSLSVFQVLIYGLAVRQTYPLSLTHTYTHMLTLAGQDSTRPKLQKHLPANTNVLPNLDSCSYNHQRVTIHLFLLFFFRIFALSSSIYKHHDSSKGIC